MHSGKRPKVLAKYLSARVTGNEEERVKKSAEANGLTKSEWCRQAKLKALDVTPDTRLLLSELSALRAVFLTLQLEAINGRKLSAEQVNQLVEKADREKFTMADNRIHKYQSQALPSAPTKLPPGGA